MKWFKPSKFFMFAIFLTSSIFVGELMAHEPLQWNGDKVHVLLEKDNTNGSLGMFTVEIDGPKGPPRHIHEDADEAFYVLEGELEVLVGDKTQVVAAGESAFAPKGQVHTFKMKDDTGGKVLIVVTPGGFEGFFGATIDLKLPDQMPDLEKISAEYGQKFAGPPLGKE